MSLFSLRASARAARPMFPRALVAASAAVPRNTRRRDTRFLSIVIAFEILGLQTKAQRRASSFRLAQSLRAFVRKQVAQGHVQ
jgi:hypothetical protein